ncbi:cysteine methyltransferase [Actinotalea ferrariae CF5-4]|uniref:methylated-DNA--[protein]-cysteine S-methyltransferase n=1 Tax=Actinotalea ferrariae CF5-4 TaxID=948458 RepID=A0A021VQF6_9CELL|nr:cysteine methyltransferase [Actinotalea ferrariae CF5-4]
MVAACRAMLDAGGPVPAAELERVTAVSPRQLTRDFAAVVGVGPRAFGHAVRTGRARDLLRAHGQVTDAVFAAGFGSTRAFYETAGPTLGMEPRRYARGGAGQALRWTAVGTDLGTVVAVAGDLGLTAVRIGDDVEALLAEVRAELPAASFERDDDGLVDLAAGLRALAAGGVPERALPLDLHGTAFQARVWDALRRIPAGRTRSYTEVAAEIGSPTAVRAVASACARNPVALVVPCHRVIRGDGTMGGYRWGLAVKERLLARERDAAAGHGPASDG